MDLTNHKKQGPSARPFAPRLEGMSLSRDAHGLHLLIEPRPADAEEPGRLSLVSPGLLQRPEHDLPLVMFTDGLEHVPPRRGFGPCVGAVCLLTQILGQVVPFDDVAPGEIDAPLDHVLQLPDIARPVVVIKDLPHLCRDVMDIGSEDPVVLVQEVLHQQVDVAAALPERRDVQVDDVEPVEEVGPKPSLYHQFFEIPVGGCNEPGIDLLGCVRAYGLETLVLYHPEELALQRQGQICDLVEEERTAVGHGEFAFFAGTARARERTWCIAEKL